ACTRESRCRSTSERESPHPSVWATHRAAVGGQGAAVTGSRAVLVLANPKPGTGEEDQIEEVCRALTAESPSGIEVRRPASDREYTEAVASIVAGQAEDGRDVVVL